MKNLTEQIERINKLSTYEIGVTINEQKPDNLMPFQPDNPSKTKTQIQNKDSINLEPDTLVDIVSGIIDGVPGIGNLLSAGIDITHALTYLGRFFLSKNEESKIENGVMAIITFGSTFIPIGGNALNVMAKKGISEVMKETPKEILLIAKKMGLYDKTVIILNKSRWKYSLLFALARILSSFYVGNFLTDLTNKFNDLKKKISGNIFGKQFLTPINFMISFLNEMSSDWDLALKLQGVKK
jgi:hypothetical protein